MKNLDIRQSAYNAGVKLWQVADAVGLNDGNFSRKLRHELPDEEKQKILTIIQQLSKEANS